LYSLPNSCNSEANLCLCSKLQGLPGSGVLTKNRKIWTGGDWSLQWFPPIHLNQIIKGLFNYVIKGWNSTCCWIGEQESENLMLHDLLFQIENREKMIFWYLLEAKFSSLLGNGRHKILEQLFDTSFYKYRATKNGRKLIYIYDNIVLNFVFTF